MDLEFVKVQGGIKTEPREIKIEPEIKFEPKVEIGIDDVLHSSDEESDYTTDIKNIKLDENNISEEIENWPKKIINKEITDDVLDETQNRADSNASKNLQTQFGTKLDKPKKVDCKEVNWAELYSSKSKGTDCTKELKEVIVTKPPEDSNIIDPHEFTRLSKTEFVCNHCQKAKKKKSVMYGHIRQHHRKVFKMYQCPYCPFKSKHSLKTHLLFRHKEDHEVEWFKCHLCSSKFRTKCRLSKHMLSHVTTEQMLDNIQTCNICEKVFKRKDDLRQHVSRVHNKDKLTKIQCQECDYVTTTPSLLENHVKRYHTDSQALPFYKCDKCNYKTRFKTSFNVHKTAKHNTELICELCSYKTYNHSKLRLHLMTHKKKLSEKDLKYKCDRCEYKTYRQYSLQIHILKHLKPEEIENFYCYHCDFKAKRKDNLKTHVLRHFKKEEVKLHCYLCDFSSKKRNLITNHIKTKHSKVVPS